MSITKLINLLKGIKMEKDPVCGMEIKDTIKAEATVYKSKTYYFCSALCMVQFQQNPEKYVKHDDEGKHEHHHH